MTRYGKQVSDTVEKAVHDYKRGTLKIGRSGKTVKSRKQAIAIGLSEAREAGANVPSAPAGRSRSAVGNGKAAAKRRTASQRASDGV